ncbi:hypothetical protein AMJ80_02445 [bacterium SM23_31]|nr:MAG: hypothetical protein AMJ80_02445 [bacterium SM23_31]
MTQFIGNGEINARRAQLVITGNSINIPSTFTTVNATNFTNLTFTPELTNLINYDENTGAITVLEQGFLSMFATLNVQADHASAELQLIPEFNSGSGWVPGLGRKSVLTAIKPSQVEWNGVKKMQRNEQICFCIAAIDGNIAFKTEYLDPGGPNECLVPAAVLYLHLSKEFESIL